MKTAMNDGVETKDGELICNAPAGEALLAGPWRGLEHNRIIQYVSLLYSVFFFLVPYYRHTARGWAWFVLFYAVFLFLYFGIFVVRDRWRKVMLAGLYLLGFVYFPFNHGAGGVFVYAVVMTGYMIRDPRTGVALRWFAGVVAAQIAAMFLEAWLVHMNLAAPKEVTFWLVVVGMSNFAYSRQELVGAQLRRANGEIERLAQTAERERIARDLHDILGHTLTVIVIKSDLANRVFDVDPVMARREMQEVEQTARKALAEVRDAVTGYRAEGIAAEVAAARRALTAAGVQLTTNIEAQALKDSLNDRQVNALCMALREAVTNVARHARATGCNLELMRDGGVMRMTVEDNGTGAESAEGNGLRGMRERLVELGGRMERLTPKSGGTKLLVEFPLDMVGA